MGESQQEIDFRSRSPTGHSWASLLSPQWNAVSVLHEKGCSRIGCTATRPEFAPNGSVVLPLSGRWLGPQRSRALLPGSPPIVLCAKFGDFPAQRDRGYHLPGVAYHATDLSLSPSYTLMFPPYYTSQVGDMSNADSKNLILCSTPLPCKSRVVCTLLSQREL